MLTEIGFLWWVLDLVGSGAEDKDGDGDFNCDNCDFGWSFVLHPGYCHLIENQKTFRFLLLRTAIEAHLLGARTVVIERRPKFTR